MRKDLHFNIDLTLEPRYTKEFVVKKKDSINLYIELKNNGVPVSVSEQIPRLYVRKPDGTIAVQGGTEALGDNTIILDGYTVIIELKNSVLNTTGLCYAELELEDSRGTLITQTFIFEVVDRLNDTDEVIKAVDDIYLLGEIEKFIIQAKIDMALLKEQIEQGLIKINEFNEFIVQKSSELENKINDALSQIDKKTTDAKYELDVKSTECANYIKALGDNYQVSITNIGEQYLENMARKADEVIASIIGQKEDIDAYIEEKKDEVQEICDYNASLIEEKKESALNEIASAKENAVSDLDEFKDFVEDKTQEVQDICNFNASLIEEKKESALSEIESAKDDALESITAEEAEILERISNIKIEGVEGVEEAVRIAQERLQEESIKQIWNIQEETANQLDSIEAKSTSEQSNITKKANDEVKKIYDAGAEVFELVDGLDAQVENGVNLINSTISKGQNDINTNANNQVERIRETGQDIIDAVNEQEQIAQGHIKDINDAGKSAKNMLESLGSSERAEIIKTATEQKESIIEVSASKLEEINSILGVSKGEAEELLDTARTEINAHRESIDNKVEFSLTQMEQAKDAHIGEIFNYEAELKEDFKAIKDEYVEEINTIGTSKVDTLQKMMDDIDRLQERITDNLEEADNKAENLERTLTNIDKKVEEINPVIAMLDELRNVCVTLQQENQESNNNINELQNLHIEADTRIVELRRLIDLAKHYEEVVQRYIDNRSGNHDEIEARLLALEEIITSLDLSVYATTEYVDNKIEESISDFATKSEVERLISGIAGGYVGSLGAGLYTPDAPEYFNEVPMPDFEPTATFKYMYYQSTSGNDIMYYTVIYFKTNIEDLDNGKYIYFDSQGRINYSKLTENEDYVMYIKHSTSNTMPWELTSKREYYPNVALKRTRIYSHDFNIYDESGLNVVYKNTFEGGINDLDKATTAGDYSIDMSEGDFNSLMNGVKVGAGKHITGTLNVKVVGANIIQTLKLDSINKSYTRIIGQDWINVDDNSIQKEPVALIGNNPVIEMSPYFNDAPKMPLYGRKVDKVIKICDNNTWYYVFYLFEGWDANNPIFYIGESGSINLNIQENKCLYYRRLVNSNGVGEWQEYLLSDKNTIMTYISSSKIDKITVYESPAPFRKYRVDGEIYHNAVIRNDSLKVINNFDNAKISGHYEVSYTVEDEVLNAPANEFNGVLEVINAGNKIYQEIKSIDNVTAYKRVFNGVWSEWRASNVNTDDIYMKEDIDEKISDIRAYVDDFKGSIGKAVKTATMPNGVFDDVPVPADRVGYEFTGRLLCFDGSSYRATYLYNYAERGYYPLFHTGNKTEDAYMTIVDSSSTYKTVITYTKPTSANANWSGETYTFSSMYLDRHNVKLYENTMPIYLNANKEGIYREPSVGEFIGDLDNARQTGKYFVDIKKDDFKDILNMPPVKIKNDIITTLNVSKKDNVISQEITIEGVSYTRKIGGSWIGKDESYLVKADVLAKIKGVEASSYDYQSDSVKAIFDRCPAMIHHNPVHYIDCKTDVDKYARIYITATNNPMFYLFTNSNTAYIGATANTAYAQAYTYANGAWSAYNYAYVSAKLTEYKIYHNTLPICKGTSSSNYDKNTILFEASTNEAEKVISDFNKADKYGVYNVEIAEGTFCANPPVNTAINGILEVVIVGERIIQTLTTANNTVYKRVLNGSWTQWKEEAEAEKIGLISSSEEEGSITDFNNAIYHKIYEVYQVGWVLENAPTDAVIEGIMTVNETNRYITQSLLDKHAQEYRRTYIKSTDTWSDWKGIGLNPEIPANEIIG